jgi:hypothetical protein
MNKARRFTQASPELERLYLSIHEAGHAVAGCLSRYAVDYATILANKQSEHGAVHYLHKGRRLGEELSEAEMIKDLRRMLRVDAAGAVAEYIAYTREEDVEPLPYWREVEEDGRITEALMVEVDKLHPGLAMSLPTEFGPGRLLPETQAMLTEHWGAVMEVAASLCTNKLIGGREVRAAVRRQRTDRS